MDSWIEAEFGSLDLGDVRRHRRFQKVAQTMWQSPQASAGGASGDWAEAKATYRLWETEEVTPQAILAAHRDQVLERAKPHRVLLHIQDTTELDFSKKKALQGAGPLSDKRRQGFFAHSEYVLQGDGVPLGLWYSHMYARSLEEHGKKSAARKKLPIEEKESYRWLKAYRRACELRALSPKQLVISLGDREADIYESLQEYHQRKERREPVAHFILRSKHDRNITPQPQDQAVHTHLKAAVAAAPLLGTMTLTIREKEQCKKVKGNRRITLRSARQAVLEIRACSLELIPPGRPKGRELTPIKIWVVMAKEINPPAGEEPIEWILLTDFSVRTLKKARQILHLYSQRWQIEVFHKILKSGCHAEKCQLKEAERLLPRLALQMIIAWRIHAMTLLGRACPDLPCGVLFEEWEWKPVVVIFRGPGHEQEEPSLAQMNEWVGRLGGHLGRKSDGPPGPQTIWKGLARVRDFGQLWIALHLSQQRG